MAQKPPLLDEATAKERLREYIFHKRISTEVLYVPHRVPRDVASRFIRDEVKDELKLEAMANACRTARFYLLKDCLDHLREFLDESVNDVSDAWRSMEVIQLLGDLGDATYQKTAFKYFQKLVEHRKFEEFADQMIRTYFHLGSDASSKRLADQLKTIYKKRKDALSDAEHPDSPTNEAFDWVERKLPQAEAAKKKKESIVGSRTELRPAGLARVYLGMVDYSVFGQEWAGYALIREADRTDEESVVKGVRQAYQELAGRKFDLDEREMVEEYLDDAKARTRDAITYFGGDLTEDENTELGSASGENLFTPSPD